MVRSGEEVAGAAVTMDISGIFNRPGTQSVSDAIQSAADATGTSFDYMLATAQAESSLNPQAASATSSARGLYQFIDQTWLATLKRSGPVLGYGRYADAIVQNSSGRYDAPDPNMRRDIMALRDDPAANAAMAGALTRDNAAQLAARLGRKASDGELYIAHVLGPAGAAKLTTLAATAPTAAADAAFPSAADANRAIFYDRDGRSRSAAEVYNALIGRYDGARGNGGTGAGPTNIVTAIAAAFGLAGPIGPPTAPPAATSSASTVRATSAAPVGAPLVIVPGTATTATAADTSSASADTAAPPESSGRISAATPLFRGLFSDSGGPSRQFVSELWTARAGRPVPGQIAPTADGEISAATRNGPSRP
jgi:transglycosylase-like protein with SLT domain